MTPEEWREGMKNEAQSVNDARWAAETRMQANKHKNGPTLQTWLVWLIGFTAFTTLWTLAVNFYLFTHSNLLIVDPFQSSIGKILIPLPGLMVLFFLSYFLTRKNSPVWAVLGFILASGALQGVISRLVTVPFTPSDGLVIIGGADLLPSTAFSWASLGVGLLWMSIPVTCGILTARWGRRTA